VVALPARLLAARRLTLKDLSVLKSDRARAVRFSTLAALCAALECQPGDLFGYRGTGATRAL
jgi:putative transcriptional regulator